MKKDKIYKNRIADKVLEKKLKSSGAVLIEGPKWCGKTTTAEQIANSILYLTEPEKVDDNIKMSEINPKMLLNGNTPRLIDEWQVAPKLWDAIRYEIDHRNDEGQFILTGSSVPADMKDVRHSGTGRFGRMLMRPMSLYESGESNGSVSLNDLFNGEINISGNNDLLMEDIAYLVCRGGWPRSIFMDKDIALEQAFDYYDAVVNIDISAADGIAKNPERTKKIMKSYARNLGTQVSYEKIKEDISINENTNVDTDTITIYLNALKSIFVIEECPAWNPNLRSKTAIRTSDTRYYIDSSIGVAALGIGPKDLLNDLNTFGLLFETLAIRDLRVYSSVLNGQIYHYRDADGLECDAVIHLRDGKYGLIEIKTGGNTLIEEGVNNLTKLYNKIDSSKMNNPSFMMILTAVGDYAYKREDGIYIVPIGCLKD